MAMAVNRRTKIVATIGPASDSVEMLHALVAAGVDGMRLNFSHGTHEDHAQRAELIRRVQVEVGRPLSIIADLQGPKLRVGELPAPIELVTGDDVTLIGGEQAVDGALPVSPAVIGDVLRPGHHVLIDDGLIRLKVNEVEHGRVRCAVLVGGPVSAHKGVNLPGVPLPIPSLTRKDIDDLDFALDLGVDYVALSFVRSAADVRDLRKLIDEAGATALVIAKIEKREGVEALDDILVATDGVMVARGDLGVEIGPAAVPLLQKRIILKALERGKPVITATQMLESMLHQPEPTRAEASDVANAILDGTSAVMLSGETAVGAFPIEAVRTMDTIAREIEPALGYEAILVPTFSGRTASMVARLRPRRPIIGLTHHQHSLQQMAIEWGVTPLPIAQSGGVEQLWPSSLEAAKVDGLDHSGERVVLTAGTAVNIPGSTNVIKVDRVP